MFLHPCIMETIETSFPRMEGQKLPVQNTFTSFHLVPLDGFLYKPGIQEPPGRALFLIFSGSSVPQKLMEIVLFSISLYCLASLLCSGFLWVFLGGLFFAPSHSWSLCSAPSIEGFPFPLLTFHTLSPWLYKMPPGLINGILLFCTIIHMCCNCS